MHDIVRNKSDEIAIDRGCYFDIKSADRVRYFFERFLRHSKGQFHGKKFELLPWQWEGVIAPLFGWKMPDGTRRFKRGGFAVPKKNGKSTLFSGIGLYMLLGDGEYGAEVYSAAADRDQAAIIYRESANMVEASPELASMLRVVQSVKIIEFPGTNSWYKALSADVPTKEGLNIHCLLFDELHAQKTDELWNTLKFGGAARRQPLILWITTAGTDTTSLCFRQWQRAKAIQESREIDIAFLPYIVETEKDADWTAQKTWEVANPSYGITIGARDFEDDCNDAKRSPRDENTFKRYRLNMWTSQISRWLSGVKWEACKRSFGIDNQKKQKCIIGLDLSSTTDLSAAVALFKEGQRYRALPFFWLPYDALKTRERDNRTRLDVWASEGLIKLTDGDVIDYEVIRNDLNALADIFNVTEVAIDPWNATQIAVDLQKDGFKVEYVRQGYYSISAATKEFEKLVLSQQFEHPGNDVYTWTAANVGIETDASGNIKPSKRKSSEKIDGIAATITALARFLKDVKKPSKYERGGLHTVGKNGNT